MIGTKRFSTKKILLLIASIAIIISLLFVLRYHQKVKYENSFDELLEQKEYRQALDLYREIQLGATDLESSVSNRNRYIEIKNQYEAKVKTRTEQIISNLKKGGSLSQDDRNFVSGMEEMTSSIIAPFLYTETEEWLDNQIDQIEWKHFITEFEHFQNLQNNVENLISQEEQLKKAANEFAMIDAKDIKNDWNTIWQDWQKLTEDPEIGRFARNYAAYRLQVFQKDIYTILMQDIDDYIFAHKYYSAKLILDRLFDAFPNEKAIQEKLQICNEKIPARLIVWEDPVENIAVMPLVADTKKAKSGSYAVFAETGMITPKEFENLLNQLYENDYVLISQSLFHDYPEDFSQVMVPEGKKPLVLILEQYQYSTRYTESGSIEQLTYNEEQNKFLARCSANQKDSEADNLDPICILENFLIEHSDFSFDGAKAMLALNIDENILGYMISDEQLQNVNTARKKLELEPHILSDKSQEDRNKFYTLQMEDLKKLLSGLQRNGYQFANAGYSCVNLRECSDQDFEEQIQHWEKTMNSLIGPVDALLFPAGAHVYNDSQKLDFIIESDYCNLYSESPKIYNYHAPEYLHFDFFPVNGNSLLNAEAWGFSRFGDVSKIIEGWREQ